MVTICGSSSRQASSLENKSSVRCDLTGRIRLVPRLMGWMDRGLERKTPTRKTRWGREPAPTKRRRYGAGTENGEALRGMTREGGVGPRRCYNSRGTSDKNVRSKGFAGDVQFALDVNSGLRCYRAPAVRHRADGRGFHIESAGKLRKANAVDLAVTVQRLAPPDFGSFLSHCAHIVSL